MARILLLYDSRGGLTERLADGVEAGVVEAGAECIRRRVDDAEPELLLECDGVILGSPNWSGVTGKMKEWWDQAGARGESGAVGGKVCGAFTAGYSRGRTRCAVPVRTMARRRTGA